MLAAFIDCFTLYLSIADVVYIGTHNPSHAPITKHMLNAGKHALCEVPMCLNTKQMQEIHALAKEKKKFFMEVSGVARQNRSTE